MTASLVDSNTFTFADGSGGHVCNLGSAPSAGQLDVLCVNSNTTVTTPSGFTAAPTHVSGQGAYIFRRIASGGEASTVTITTSGDHNTAVCWSRWGNIVAADDAAKTTAETNGTATPAHTTNTLAEANELVVAFGALHNFSGSNPTSPSWSSGYTGLLSASQGTGGSGVVGYMAYKLTAGTAAETPQVSWTNQALDRYMMTLTFTTSAGGSTVNADASLTATAARTVTAAVDRPTSASPTTTATVTATAAADRPATAALTAAAAITAAASVDRAASAALTVAATVVSTADQPTRNATSTAAVAAGRTSTAAVAARRTSTPGVT